MSRKKFNILVLDPPWQYSDKAGDRGAEARYATMSFRELSELRVSALADDNCACFLWVTGPFMMDGLRLLKMWGFQYKNVCFTWIKKNKKSDTLFTGMGHYSRSNAEFVLLGMKGKLDRESKSVHSVVMAPVGEHSAKPAQVMDRIVDLFGDLPRLEIFARNKTPGWEQTGLELDGMDVRDYIESVAPVRKGLAALKRRT